MKHFITSNLLIVFVALLTTHAPAAVRYVNVNNANPVSPFISWATAATKIQDAVDVSQPGDQVLVTNGVYASGGRLGSGALTNRVLVDKAITLQSVNGPNVTVIQGYQMPGATNGNSAVRCAHVAEGAALVGFTLTAGATRTNGSWDVDQSGGGVWCASTNVVLSNCVLQANAAWDSGGAAFRGRLENCTIQSNFSLSAGGGAYGSTLKNCLLEGNYSEYGGGSYGNYFNPAGLDRCTLRGNTAFYEGGGASGSTLTHCSLSNNVAFGDPYGTYGGGAVGGEITHCLFVGNFADYGGGAASADLYNCALFDNSATIDGGGMSYCLARNCTIAGNFAGHTGGGSQAGDLYNCIIYYNTAPGAANWSGSGCSHCDPINFCCTTPLPAGTGNITTEPQLADVFHLSVNSPCRGAGNSAYATGLDFDGEAWAIPPSIGCDEYRAGGITGPLTVSIQTTYTNVATGFLAAFTARIGGHAGASRWDFGDLTVVSNRPSASHRWNAAGQYKVILSVFNESYPAGISATASVSVVEAPVHYVNPASVSAVPPYSSWATAATQIQPAIDAASVPGALVLVTNGIYQSGGLVVYGALTNRVAVTKPITVRSVNGPAVTIIRGAKPNGNNAVRCVYLTNGAALEGFTLTNGATRTVGNSVLEQRGGALWCEPISALISNCVLTGSSAVQGGAAYGGTLKNCTLTGNTSTDIAGGAEASTLDNCTISFNSAGGYGGGLHSATLNNCTVQSNTTPAWAGGVSDAVLNNCLLIGNSAGGSGGGAYDSFLQNCWLMGNSAISSGGGASFSSVANCLVTTNWAGRGGGAAYGSLKNSTFAGNVATNTGGGVYDSDMNNCIVYYNTAPGTPDFEPSCTGCYTNAHCCTTTPLAGPNNFTNAPLFVNLAVGNYRLQSNSPCINAGRNGAAGSGLDLDGNARIAGGTVDVGAYEFSLPSSIISYFWLWQNGLPIDGSADYLDPDGDGMQNWKEWKAGTNPTNQLSLLRLLSLTNNGPAWTVSWQSVANRTYFLQRSANVGIEPFTTLQDNISGQPGITSFADTNALDGQRLFYRVGVKD